MTPIETFITKEFWLEHEDFDDYTPLFLAFLEANKELCAKVDEKGYRTNTAYYWNNFIDGKNKSYENNDLIFNLFYSPFASRMWSKEPNDPSFYGRLIDYINSGLNINHSDWKIMNGSKDPDECFNSGKRLKLVFTEPFKPEMFIRSSKDYKYLIAPLNAPPKIEHLILDCPTGELIAQDWLRIEPFTNAVRLPYTQELSVNHNAGRINHIKESNKQFNLLDLMLHNFRVEVFKKDDLILVGDSYNSDLGDDIKLPKGYKHQGDICTDRWSMACIDRFYLEQHIAESHPNPKEIVDSYLKNEKPVQIKVKPGKYHVYFTGECCEFNKLFDSPDYQIPKGMHAYAIISDKELTLNVELDASLDIK